MRRDSDGKRDWWGMFIRATIVAAYAFGAWQARMIISTDKSIGVVAQQIIDHEHRIGRLETWRDGARP